MSSEFDMISGSWIATPDDRGGHSPRADLDDNRMLRLQVVAAETGDATSRTPDWLKSLDVDRIIAAQG